MTILLLVGLIPHVSTTVKAVEVSDFEYIKYYSYNGFYYASLSDQPYTTYTTDTDTPADTYIDNNMGLKFQATKTQTWVSIKTFNSNLEQIDWNAYIAVYYPTGWELMNPFMVGSNVLFFPTNYEVTDLTGFPTLEFESLDDAIADFENKLNATTNSSVIASTVQNQVNSASEQYNYGLITIEEYEEIVDTGAERVNALNNLSTNTIADQIAINNAQNAIAIAKNQINSEANRSELEEINTNLNEFYESWSNDHTISDIVKQSGLPTTPQGFTNFVTQNVQNFRELIAQNAMTENEVIWELIQLQTMVGALSTQDWLTSADRGYLDQVSKTIEQTITMFENEKDIDRTVSDKSQYSDVEEISLLNEMVSVMQDQTVENKLQDQQISGNAEAINNILNPVWGNKFFTYLIGTSGVLIIACILLHTRYRML